MALSAAGPPGTPILYTEGFPAGSVHLEITSQGGPLKVRAGTASTAHSLTNRISPDRASRKADVIPLVSRLRKSLAWKMGFSVGLILLLSIGAFTFFNIRDLRQQLLTRLILRAERFSETVQRATGFGMLLNDREHVLKIVEALGSQEGIENIRVFSKKGVVMYSSQVKEIGTALTKQDSACTVYHGPPYRWKNCPSPSGHI